MLNGLLERADDYMLSSVRHVVGLDDPDVIREFEEKSGATFWAAYGESETSGLISCAPYFEKPGSAGIPSFLADVEIMDEHGNFLGANKTGEIVVRGPLVLKGYWNREKENEFTFRDGWHHTGDLGSIDEEGYLWYWGQTPAKKLIKPGGENVYPAEVEKVILEHPAVESAVVIGVPDTQWGEAIKAVCVLKPSQSLREIELIDFVAARMARYKKPKSVAFVSEIPKKPDGFIDRAKVKAVYGKT
jgi:acyl-CoA synthetase (AMP-forming)/AMP-acid ligase II